MFLLGEKLQLHKKERLKQQNPDKDEKNNNGSTLKEKKNRKKKDLPFQSQWHLVICVCFHYQQVVGTDSMQPSKRQRKRERERERERERGREREKEGLPLINYLRVATLRELGDGRWGNEKPIRI